jgi:ATP-dependent exoDNAse (exonuclease V) beta subunit
LVASDGLPDGSVEVGLFRSASEEAAYLAGVLRTEHLSGVAWSRMAILVRSTTQTLGTLRRAMITAGVPVAVRGDDIPLAEQPAVAMLLDLLGCTLDPRMLTEELAETLFVGQPGGGDSIQLRRLRRLLRQHFGEQDGRLVALLWDLPGAEQLPEHVRWPAVRIARVLAAGVQQIAAGASAEAVLWAIWEASGLARRWEAASLAGGTSGAAADRDLDAVVQLFDAAARFTDRLPSAKPGLFAEHLRAQQIPGDTFTGGSPEPEAVPILTAHASKGLEWDVVCIAGVQEGTWPDLRRRGSLLGTEQLVDAVRGIESFAHSYPNSSLAPQLAEERRLFYVAATRARNRLVVTAVSGEDEQPSRLLDEVDPLDGERPLTQALRGVHLPGLVAELRAVACAPDEPEPQRRAAASELARLSHAGVAGADPDEWWGLAELSTDAGVADVPVRVSPSRVESFLSCELRALMKDLGVADDKAIAASLGIVVHDLASRAPDDQSLEEFERQLQDVWDDIDFGASWFAANERARASTMLERLVSWLRASREQLTRLAVEQDFSVEVGDAIIAGRVDRLERDADGGLVVVDLKTGKSKPRDTEMQAHPQLGTYQLAIEHGAFAEHGTTAGGAVLVQLGASGRSVEQWQLPLAQSDDPQWARRAVDHVAARMQGSEFDAIENSRCHLCEVRTCCPLQVQGRQVPS